MNGRRLGVGALVVVVLVAGLAWLLWPKPPPAPPPPPVPVAPAPVAAAEPEDSITPDEPDEPTEPDEGVDAPEPDDEPKGFDVSGVVITSSGNPADGADVRLDSSDGWGNSATATADAKGQFTLTGIRREGNVVSARWHDEAGESVVARGARTPVRIVTARAGSLLVTLTGASGERVPGFEVTAFNPSHVKLERTSDAQGQARFEALQPGHYEVGASRNHHSYSNLVVVAAGETATLEIKISENLELTGVVRGPHGPVFQADLDVDDLDGGSSVHASSFATTDEEGHFAAAVHAGRYEVRVRHREGTATVVAEVPGPPLEITLSAPAALLGRVVDANGAALPGFLVELVHHGQNSRHEFFATTERNGTFRLTGVPPGEVLVRARRDDDGDARRVSQVVQLESGVTTNVTLKLDGSGNRLAGRVLDDQHQPLAESQLNLNWEKGGHAYARSGPDGAFSFDHIPADKVNLQVNHENFASAFARDLKLPDEHHDVVLVKRGSVTGHVVDAAGRPVTRFAIDGKVYESDDGSFTLTPYEVGPQALVLEAPGVGQSAWAYEVRSGQPTDLGNLSAVPRPKVKVKLHATAAKVAAFVVYGTDRGPGAILSVPAFALDEGADMRFSHTQPAYVGFDASNEATVIAPATAGFALMVVGSPQPKQVPLNPGASAVDVTLE